MRFRSPFLAFSLPFILLLSSLAANSAVKAETLTLPLSKMGDYALTWSTASAVDARTTEDRLGLVTFKPGQSEKLSLPVQIRRSVFLKENGSQVVAGEKIASLQGIEVGHFMEEAKAAEQVYVAARAHFEAVKPQASGKTLTNPEWLAITQNYYQAKLNAAHFEHVLSLIKPDGAERIALFAPITGYLRLMDDYTGMVGDVMAEIIPTSALLVAVTMPQSNVSGLTAFSTSDGKCSLTLDELESRSSNFMVTAWARLALPSDCDLAPGATVAVTPHYDFSGYTVPEEAVFVLNDSDYLAVREASSLKILKVETLGSDGNQLFVRSAEPFDDKPILTGAVSALQGILLGMGGE